MGQDSWSRVGQSFECGFHGICRNYLDDKLWLLSQGSKNRGRWDLLPLASAPSGHQPSLEAGILGRADYELADILHLTHIQPAEEELAGPSPSWISPCRRSRAHIHGEAAERLWPGLWCRIAACHRPPLHTPSWSLGTPWELRSAGSTASDFSPCHPFPPCREWSGRLSSPVQPAGLHFAKPYSCSPLVACKLPHATDVLFLSVSLGHQSDTEDFPDHQLLWEELSDREVPAAGAQLTLQSSHWCVGWGWGSDSGGHSSLACSHSCKLTGLQRAAPSGSFPSVEIFFPFCLLIFHSLDNVFWGTEIFNFVKCIYFFFFLSLVFLVSRLRNHR